MTEWLIAGLALLVLLKLLTPKMPWQILLLCVMMPGGWLLLLKILFWPPSRARFDAAVRRGLDQ